MSENGVVRWSISFDRQDATELASLQRAWKMNRSAVVRRVLQEWRQSRQPKPDRVTDLVKAFERGLITSRELTSEVEAARTRRPTR